MNKQLINNCQLKENERFLNYENYNTSNMAGSLSRGLLISLQYYGKRGSPPPIPQNLKFISLTLFSPSSFSSAYIKHQ